MFGIKKKNENLTLPKRLKATKNLTSKTESILNTIGQNINNNLKYPNKLIIPEVNQPKL